MGLPAPVLYALYALATIVAALGVGIFVYVAGSFLLMRPHVAPRPEHRALREALREAMWVWLTQPLLPLYYFVGRRMAPPPTGTATGTSTPVVAIHGYTQNRVDFLGLARACRRAGVGPVYGMNYPWFGSIRGNARRLARFIERVLRETGAPRVDLVAHSLGGLVAMEYLHTAGSAQVRRIVTIASPHAGVPWQGPIPGKAGDSMRAGLVAHASKPVPVPCLSVYSTHDNVVHPPSTSELSHRGAQDRAFEHTGHLSILFEQDVLQAVVEFLRAGDSAAA
jgi:pimeloyl-ACP methyl ester carboxylesterase